MKLSKYNLKLTLSKLNIVIDSDSDWEAILDTIYERIDVTVGPFYREIANRDFLLVYEDRYPLYADMHRGVKSSFVSRIVNNDLECLVLVHDSVLSGLDGLYIAYATEERNNMELLFAAIKFDLNFYCKQLKVKSSIGHGGDNDINLAIVPVASLLSSDKEYQYEP